MAVKAELEERGFENPTYIGGHRGHDLYGVDLGNCRLTIAASNGKYAWLVMRGNNAGHDQWVVGDHQLNAAWLKANPTGPAPSRFDVGQYDLEPCLA